MMPTPTRAEAFALYTENVLRWLQPADGAVLPPLSEYEREVVRLSFEQAMRVDHCATAIRATRALSWIMGGRSHD